MSIVPELSGKCTSDDYVALCDLCGFYFGKGEKENLIWDPYPHPGPDGLRGVVGLTTYKDLNELEVESGELISVLNDCPEWIKYVDPFKAENLVCKLLHDAYGWDVAHIGGRRDKGIDAIAVMSDAGRAIVQIKWRQDHTVAESVRTVRELAGTLLNHGIPQGLLVTTARDLSAPAQAEAEAIASREIVGIGRLDIDWRSYSNVLDMLEIASTNVDSKKRVPFPNPDGDFHIFDGGGIWDENWHNVGASMELDQFAHAVDPFDVLSKQDIHED
jgi:hypothetical protein